jgi:hypothetical protein
MNEQPIESVLLYRAASQIEASLLEAMLTESGIGAWTVGGQAAIGFGELGADAQCVDIRVPASQHAEALGLLDKHYAKTTGQGLGAEIWTCKNCGETAGPTFSSCWNCETPKQP